MIEIYNCTVSPLSSGAVKRQYDLFSIWSMLLVQQWRFSFCAFWRGTYLILAINVDILYPADYLSFISVSFSPSPFFSFSLSLSLPVSHSLTLFLSFSIALAVSTYIVTLSLYIDIFLSFTLYLSLFDYLYTSLPNPLRAGNFVLGVL